METLRLLYKRWPQCVGFYKMAVAVFTRRSLFFFSLLHRFQPILTASESTRPNFFNKIISFRRDLKRTDHAKNILYTKITILPESFFFCKKEKSSTIERFAHTWSDGDNKRNQCQRYRGKKRIW